MEIPKIVIRKERPNDIISTKSITSEAFEGKEYSAGNETAIVDGLRDAKALHISLVATVNGEVVGHAAFSPITIDGCDLDWYGLGPVSVKPAFQSKGVGTLLVSDGLQQLWLSGARGCVVLGNAGYYRRFGFQHFDTLIYPDGPAEHFLALSKGGPVPAGTVSYHSSFSAS